MLFAAVAMFAAGSFRHYVLRSGAFDLGFFDQAVWLISQGHVAFSSLRGIHVIADHASLILYPLALLYVVWADPHVLLAAQAAVLALGAYPVARLAMDAGLTQRQSLAIAGAYLMYPFVLTASLFDFHPETLAVPALLMAVLAAREDRRIAFCIWIAIALLCKEIIALTVAMMGLWLLLFERRKFFGTTALVAGAIWFVVALKVIVPAFSEGGNPSGMDYYSYLGNSIGQIIWTMITRPDVVLARIFSVSGIKYIALLVMPALWGLHYRTLTPLIVCLPTALLNILSEVPAQRSPFYQYSLPMVPFFFVAIIMAVSSRRALIIQPRYIVTWAVSLLVLGFAARMARMNANQGVSSETLQHAREAIALVPSTGSVLTTFEAVPHLSHRLIVHYVGGHNVTDHLPLNEYDSFLLNVDHTSVSDYEVWVEESIALLRKNPEFAVVYDMPDVVLFVRTSLLPATRPVPTVAAAR